MKKNKIKIFLLAGILCLCLSLSACGGESEEPCVRINVQNAQETFVISEIGIEYYFGENLAITGGAQNADGSALKAQDSFDFDLKEDEIKDSGELSVKLTVKTTDGGEYTSDPIALGTVSLGDVYNIKITETDGVMQFEKLSELPK